MIYNRWVCIGPNWNLWEMQIWKIKIFEKTNKSILEVLLHDNSHFGLPSSLYITEKYNFFICTFYFFQSQSFVCSSQRFVENWNIKTYMDIMCKWIWLSALEPNTLHHSNIIQIEIMNGLIFLQQSYKLEIFFTVKCKIFWRDAKKIIHWLKIHDETEKLANLV